MSVTKLLFRIRAFLFERLESSFLRFFFHFGLVLPMPWNILMLGFFVQYFLYLRAGKFLFSSPFSHLTLNLLYTCCILLTIFDLFFHILVFLPTKKGSNNMFFFIISLFLNDNASFNVFKKFYALCNFN